MGQAAKKNKFYKDFTTALLKYHSSLQDNGAHSDEKLTNFLAVCQVVGTRWHTSDPDFLVAYQRTLTGDDEKLKDALVAFFDTFLSATWPRDDAQTEFELTLALVVQVLPTFGDLIGQFDDVQSLECQVLQHLGLENAVVRLAPQLHELSAFQGWNPLCRELAPAKAAAHSKSRRYGMRFSTEVAVAPVVRVMWLTVTLADAVSAERLLDRMRQGVVPAPPLAASLPYTVKAVTQEGEDTQLAGVLGLHLGLPLSSTLNWAFHEGDAEVKAALAQLKARASDEAAGLLAKVVVTPSPDVAMPEGVVGGERASDFFGKALPQLQVVFYRKSPHTGIPAVEGRALYCRFTPEELAPALQSLLRILARNGIEEVEVVRPQ